MWSHGAPVALGNLRGTWYAVQVGAFRGTPEKEWIEQAGERLIYEPFPDGLARWYAGVRQDRQASVSRKEELQEYNAFADAFVVRLRDGVREVVTPEEVGREEDSLAWTQSQTQGQAAQDNRSPTTTSDLEPESSENSDAAPEVGASLGSEENAESEMSEEESETLERVETQASPALRRPAWWTQEKLQHGMWTSPNTTAPCRPKMLRRSFSKLQIGGCAAFSCLGRQPISHGQWTILQKQSGFWRPSGRRIHQRNLGAGVRVNQRENVMKMKEQVRMGFKWLAMGLMAWVTSVGAQTPVLNELMASNDLAHYDDFFEFDDWVELYNPGGLLQLAGYHLSDNPSNLTKYTIPDTDPGTTFLTPGDHMVIWLDKDSAQGVLHANFKLSSENEGLWFTAPDGVTVLDSIVYPPQQTDISYGRACDGCEMWEYFNVPTPEATNAQTQIPTPFLYINEVLLENTGALVDESFEAEPWLEIYNPNANQVNLGGYTVAVQGGASYTLPLDNPVETTIEGEGFLLLWMDGEPEEGGHHLDFVPAMQTKPSGS